MNDSINSSIMRKKMVKMELEIQNLKSTIGGIISILTNLVSTNDLKEIIGNINEQLNLLTKKLNSYNIDVDSTVKNIQNQISNLSVKIEHIDKTVINETLVNLQTQVSDISDKTKFIVT